jgi:hypothetical protein
MKSNRIFSINGEGWPGFPSRAFARLDQTEPIDPRQREEAVFAFDAVDASWPGFGIGGTFDLAQEQQVRNTLSQFWTSMFGSRETRPQENPFDEMPIYRVEVTSRPGDAFWETLQGFLEEDWITLELDSSGSFPVDVYGGILAAAVEASLLSATITSDAESAALSAAFDIDLWPDATDTDIDQVLAGRGALESLVGYDVGQGSAVGLLDAGENALLFFDLGAGAWGNKKTRPNPLRFCWRKKAPVILSHWDTDHWAGELSDPLAAQTTWLAPRQSKLGPSHNAFAGRILASGGTLLIWGAPAGTVRTHTLAPGQTLTLARCTGSSRNGSGIAGLVEASNLGQAWLLTGDAGYHELGLTLPTQLSTVVAPHHGADMGSRSVAPTRPYGYTRLIYSFGPGNTHGRTRVTHPTSVAVTHHHGRGWSHGSWSLAIPALLVAGGDVLATAENPSRGSVGRHLDSTASGWSRSPAVPFRTVPCAATPASTTGCTTNVVQA